MAEDREPIKSYRIKKVASLPALNADWDNLIWRTADTLEVSHFRPESSDHHPKTSSRLLYTNKGIAGIFRVEDRFVRCIRNGYQSEVWKDSCVEFFVQPKAHSGYFNFEFNCGGSFLCCYIVNSERTPGGFKEFTRVPWDIAQAIQVRSSLPERIDPEIAEPLTWALQFYIPLTVFAHYVTALDALDGQNWRGNFFKCAEDLSHPHWATWSPVDEFNFHLPRCFGDLRFASSA